MTAITSISLTSPNTQASAAFAVGQGFKKGDIPAGQYITTDQSNVSCIPLATWNDGSLKHARLVGSVALTANTPLVVNLSSTSTAPTGTSLTSASITAANPTASVQCGSYGTVSLASLLASPFRTVASTPNMVECHYQASVPGTLLSVWFHVSLWANGAIKIRAAVENGYLDNGVGATASNADISYVPTVTIGGTVVYNNGGASLTHCRNTRWKASGWIGGDPQVTPSHNTAYLRSTKLVPNYALSTATSAQLDALTQTYAPMSPGAIPAAMATGGANPTIALLPQWDATYVGTGDVRAYRAVLAASDALNSFGIVWRDYTTKDIIKPNSFPTWSIYGPGGSNDKRIDLSNGTAWEINHHPGVGYTAYLLTGDWWHYETMMLHLSCIWAMRGTMSINDSSHGSGTGRVLANETRGGAWSARTMNIACGLMPDSEKAAGKVGAEYRELLANNMLYWKSLIDKPGINQLGFLYEWTQGSLGPYGPGLIAPWQQLWWVQADGFGSDLEPLADMTTYIAVRNYRYQAIVGMLGAVGGFAFDCASTYVVKISNGTDADPTTWFSDWSQVFNATFATVNSGGGPASIPHTGTLLNGGNVIDDNTVPSAIGAGDPADASSGRWGYLLPAIAYAVDHGATGAAAAWARVSGASNYSTLTGAFANQSSQWGVFPRNAGVAVTHAIGPAIRFGRMRAGRITISKYHGNGIPASAIPTGFAQPALLLNDVDSVNDPAGTVYRLEMAVPTTSTGTPAPFVLNDDSSFSIVGAADGVYTSTQSIYKNGVLAYTSPFSVTVGAAPAATVTMVTVSPLTVSVAGAATQQFSAAVVGTNSPAQTVTWSVTGGGSINSSGLFTAPAATSSAQTITVRATSTVDNTKSGTATVTIPAVGVATVSSVTVSPSTATLAGFAQQQFSASVAGTNNPAQTVTWSTTGGSISASGLFTAPAATIGSQSITITATSTVDGSKSGTAFVTIPAAAPSVSSVTVSPASSKVDGGSIIQFNATVSGLFNPATTVNWSASAGSIDSTGRWTAPATTVSDQVVTITATSTVDTSKSGTASVIVPSFSVPTAPQALSAVAGMETVTVTITPPLSTGGTPITTYLVVASSGQSQSVTGTTATFSLPAFVKVSFTAQAVNAMGPSPVSSPSNTVIPLPVVSTVPADYSNEPAPRGRTMRL